MKTSKQTYYDKYFEISLNNFKSEWTGIKSLISLKPSHPVY